MIGTITAVQWFINEGVKDTLIITPPLPAELMTLKFSWIILNDLLFQTVSEMAKSLKKSSNLRNKNFFNNSVSSGLQMSVRICPLVMHRILKWFAMYSLKRAT